jgi:hypothetical protein
VWSEDGNSVIGRPTMDTPFKNCTGFIAIKASKAVEMFLIELKNIKSSLVNQQQIDHLIYHNYFSNTSKDF